MFASTYQKFFKTHRRSPWMPAGLTLGVDALAPDCLVEIDAVAYLGSRGVSFATMIETLTSGPYSRQNYD